MDDRKQRTDDAIKDAFRTCLRETRAEDVTVSALCRLADVNRTTFYRHYRNVKDVFNDLETDQLNEFRELLQNEALPVETLLKESLLSIDKAQELYHIRDGRSLPESFKKELTRNALKYGFPGWRKLIPKVDEAEAFIAYEALLTGALQVVISADKEDREKVVGIIMDMVNTYIRAHS